MMTGTNIEAFVIFKQASGAGHLARCSTIATALRSISHVTMFYGGKPIKDYAAPPGVDFVQLPAVRWDLADVFPVPVDPDTRWLKLNRLGVNCLLIVFFESNPE
jgi:predicted glycosyltransferase